MFFHKYVIKKIAVEQHGKSLKFLMREIGILMAADHPYIVAYREWFVEDQEACLVMEYCGGGDLGKEIEKHKSNGTNIEEKQIIDWTLQIALALEVSY